MPNTRQSEYGEDPLACYDSELGRKMAVVMFVCSGHPRAEMFPFTFSVFKMIFSITFKKFFSISVIPL